MNIEYIISEDGKRCAAKADIKGDVGYSSLLLETPYCISKKEKDKMDAGLKKLSLNTSWGYG